MTYDQKYPQLTCVARDKEGLVKTIGLGPCRTCGEPTGWTTLAHKRVCSEECGQA